MGQKRSDSREIMLAIGVGAIVMSPYLIAFGMLLVRGAPEPIPLLAGIIAGTGFIMYAVRLVNEIATRRPRKPR